MRTTRSLVHDAMEPEQVGDQSEPVLEVPASTEVNHAYPSGARLGFFIIGLLLSMCLGALDGTILAQATSDLTESLPGVSKHRVVQHRLRQ